MKTLLLGLASFSVVIPLADAATAYDALRVVGKQHGEAILDRVIEVRGYKGAPEPRTWKVIVEDKEARSGVREFDVQGAKITAERAPATGVKGARLNMDNLKLDSEGAHTLAEREAKKTSYPYDHVDYVLQAGANGGVPVWQVRLVDSQDGRVSSLNISADDGKIVSTEGMKKSRGKNSDPEVVAANDPQDEPPAEGAQRTAVKRTVEKPREVATKEKEEPEIDKPGNKMTRFLDRVGRHLKPRFERFGDKITGKNRESAPPPPPATNKRVYRDANGTEFYRPRD